MYCLKPFLINNDLLFSFVLNKNGVAVKSCSFDIILQLRNVLLNPWSPVWLKYLDQNNLAKAQLTKIKQNRKNLVTEVE